MVKGTQNGLYLSLIIRLWYTFGMDNYIKVIQGHYTAAVERMHEFNHVPTIYQAILTTIIDIFTINRHHIVLDNGSFIVYEVIKKPLYGMKIAQVHSVYVPKALRGSGYCSKLLDMIPSEVVLCDIGHEEDKIGSIYARKRNTRK